MRATARTGVPSPLPRSELRSTTSATFRRIAAVAGRCGSMRRRPRGSRHGCGRRAEAGRRPGLTLHPQTGHLGQDGRRRIHHPSSLSERPSQRRRRRRPRQGCADQPLRDDGWTSRADLQQLRLRPFVRTRQHGGRTAASRRPPDVRRKARRYRATDCVRSKNVEWRGEKPFTSRGRRLILVKLGHDSARRGLCRTKVLMDRSAVL